MSIEYQPLFANLMPSMCTYMFISYIIEAKTNSGQINSLSQISLIVVIMKCLRLLCEMWYIQKFLWLIICINISWDENNLFIWLFKLCFNFSKLQISLFLLFKISNVCMLYLVHIGTTSIPCLSKQKQILWGSLLSTFFFAT